MISDGQQIVTTAVPGEAPSGPTVTVRTTIALSPEELDHIRAWVRKRYGEPLVVNEQVAPKLVGGVWLRVDDMVIDGSIAGRIEQLREHLHDHLQSLLAEHPPTTTE